jgi:putative addiction module killer protein
MPLAGKYPLGYNRVGLNSFLRSSNFDAWLSTLADQKAKARTLARLLSATFGNFGDCESVGEGVSEMRVHVGAGYRVYCTRTGSTVYVLLAGGVKASQTKDIAKAKKMARELKRAKQ